MNVGELFVLLGVKADTVKVKDFVKSIGEIPMTVAGGIAALAGLSFGIKELAQDAIATASAFELFQNQTGLSAQELQTWRNVAVQANVSAEAITGSVTSLQRQLAEIKMGRGNIAPFQILGIDPRQNAFRVLEQLRARIRKMDRPTATNLIQQMGLTPDMMNVLTLSDDKFKKFSQTVAGMTPRQEKAFLALRLQLAKLKLAFQDVMFRVMGSVLPALLPLINAVLPVFTRFVENLSMAFAELLKWLAHVPGSVQTLAVLFGGLALIFAPVTAGVVALLLVIEDLYVYAKGGKSVFGLALAGLKELFDHPLESAQKLLKVINEIVDAVKKFIGLGGGYGQTGGKTLEERFKGASVPSKIAMATAAQGLIPAAVALGPLALGAMGMKWLSQTNHVQIDVHSNNANADEVGKSTKKHFDDSVSDAALQAGNQEGTQP